MLISCPSGVVRDTLAALQEAGRYRRECGILWLGTRRGNRVCIKEAYRPAQYAHSRMFHFPAASIAALQERLVQKRYMIGAQVHSHPREAFHSPADDRGAVIRHGGALSLVVPHFGLHTTYKGFLADTKVFRLSDENEWIEVAKPELDECLRIG